MGNVTGLLSIYWKQSQVNQNVKMVLVVKDTGVVCKIHEMSDYFGEIFIETWKECARIIVWITICIRGVVVANRIEIVFTLQWRMTRIIATQ